jgi:peptidoglycan hydrolase-like protein with peptidoglycan-binding domain
MISRKVVLPALLLSLVAGLGVSAGSAQTSTATKKKPATGSTHKRTGAKKGTAKSSGKRGQKAPTADRISEIQTALGKDGSYSGAPNGKWDDSTVAAMKKYQAAHGLNPSGKLDAKTLQKLGLGSQTAGVAAPLPPMSSSTVSSPSNTTTATRHQ